MLGKIHLELNLFKKNKHFLKLSNCVRLFLPVSLLLLLLYEIIFLYKTGQTLQMLNCIYLVELLLKVSHEDILGKKCHHEIYMSLALIFWFYLCD